MARVMAVTFETHGQLHYLDPGEATHRVGDHVLFPTEFGPEVVQVVWAPEYVDSENLTDLPVCLGPATDADLRRDQENRRHRAEALAITKALVAEHELPMKIVAVDWIDRADDVDLMVAIYFTAPGRVDFRTLVGDLARALHARVDLRQVAGRDATRLTGGIGSCGRELCCSTFLTDFEPVGLRLAKVQGLAPNPLAIQGQCGKLMCCLKYEHPLYVEFAQQAPAVGEYVESPIGDAKVIGHSVPGQSVTVRNGHGEVARCPLTEVCVTSRRRKDRDATLSQAVPSTGSGTVSEASAEPVEATPEDAPRKKPRHKKRAGGFAGRKPPTGPGPHPSTTHEEQQ